MIASMVTMYSREADVYSRLLRRFGCSFSRVTQILDGKCGMYEVFIDGDLLMSSEWPAALLRIALRDSNP